MPKLRISLSDEECTKIQKSADAHGLTIAAYVRTVIKESLNKKADTHHADILRAIKALVPTLAEAFGITQKVSREPIDKLSQMLLERYAKACARGE